MTDDTRPESDTIKSRRILADIAGINTGTGSRNVTSHALLWSKSKFKFLRSKFI